MAAVCVTGAAGFLGSWITKTCLERGLRVRACVRSLNAKNKISFLKQMPEYASGRLTLHAADMSVAGAYDSAFAGCQTVFHTAEVFMNFAPGRNLQQAAQNFGKPITGDDLQNTAMQSSQHIVDSINKSGSVQRLIYTSSLVSMMDDSINRYTERPTIDESRNLDVTSIPESFFKLKYNSTKHLTEQFFAEAAEQSGGNWISICANPADIIGPILSSEHANLTWLGKVAGIIQGVPPPQENAGVGELRRPWFTVDVRDVAKAQLLLSESETVQTGSRFLLTDMTRIYPEDIGVRINRLFPNFEAATKVKVDSENPLKTVDPVWDEVQVRNDLIRAATGMKFLNWEDTIKDTVHSLITVGGIQPRYVQA